MANPYVSVAALKITMGLAAETFADADLTVAVDAASRGIDGVCNRRFWLDADANQVRYYTPGSADWVAIDDLITATSLLVDKDGDGTFEETWTANTDFVLEPLNAAADSRPWTKICRHPASSRWFPYYYPRSVKLTGKFGWAAIPDPIVEATGILAAKLVKRSREAPFGIASIGLDGSAVRIARNDPDVMFLVSDYIRERP